jgi:hypothetical protein
MKTKRISGLPADSPIDGSSPTRSKGQRRMRVLVWVVLACAVIVASILWLSMKATTLKSELQASANLVAQLNSDIDRNDGSAAVATVSELKTHTAKARAAGSDPMWTAAHVLPWLGPNFQAASEVATSADDLAHFAAAPLVSVFQSLKLNGLVPVGGVIDTAPLKAAQPRLASASHALGQTTDRLNGLDVDKLLPQVAAPLVEARNRLQSLRPNLEAAADAAKLAPRMLGSEDKRNYLLMIQNNAESRASGGIPGALALLTLDQGKLTLGAQSSASDLGVMAPIIPLAAEQQQIYSGRLGKFMQDVNLTPDFPTAASTAQAMWERKTGQPVSGVISIDPVALGYILDATGPVTMTQPELLALADAGLPTELSGKNVVQTLLSDVYSKIERPDLQDAYFAGVAQEIFAALSDGKANAEGLIEGLTRGTSEGRVLVWSGLPAEQLVIAKYALSGSIAGPSVAPAQFGVYFNDGTGAKMDYYVKRSVQLFKKCPRAGYEQTTVRVTSTNTAPADAATSLPAYVTGGGIFGIPAGSVQTNIVAYGPTQSNVETAMLDGQKASFAPYVHDSRPVGVLAVKLAPGETRAVEFTFGRIVQHAEPNVVVTPTVQDVNDVILPTQVEQCG